MDDRRQDQGAKLLELAARCEAASGADRELDECLEALHRPLPNRKDGWIRRGPGQFVCYHEAENFHEYFVARRWTKSVDLAAKLVPEGHSWAAGTCGEENIPWACVTQDAEPCRDFSADASTPALALTAAAIRALAAQAGEPR